MATEVALRSLVVPEKILKGMEEREARERGGKTREREEREEEREARERKIEGEEKEREREKEGG